ncbi:Uma2 family endonuclease [Scytonema hofmannii FACHB-248]|uniref:Uma2 family endonuclease n=1 Tax=Scytonema hofmannii FACHB-248 TaxID=1842502 RepID=A0ABR8GNN9_9CYAN|nr:MULTISPECIES: Uma2 family endonuclease [Nostocales]MBD2604953.1 Uma2 family endonuclease [Scytonema hofmannii FACHB-248]
MLQASNKILTLDEFLALSETKPSLEYIDGQIIQKPMPQGKHSTIQGELCPTINSVVKVQKMGWAFPELRYTFGRRSIVPDVAVFSWARLPVDENGDIANTFAAAPDWIIEILPSEQSHTKVIKKILHALNHGTQMGWLIDPDERFIAAYPAGQQPLPFEEIDGVLPVPDFCQGLQLKVSDIFGGLKVTL